MDKEASDIVYAISHNPTVNFLRYRPYHLERDVYRIACILFNIETAIRVGHVFNEVEIPVAIESFFLWNVKEIETILNSLLKEVTLNDIKINIVHQDLNRRKRNTHVDFKNTKSICLFSGGVDSSTGLLLSLEKYGDDISALFACHGDQGKIGAVVNNIHSIIDEKFPVKLDIVHIPKMLSEGYSQLRGFLYVMCAGIFAKLRHADKILITECGPTMYQIRFSPFDSITMTTHPHILAKAKSLLQLFFNRNISLITPFENLTKAEVVALNPLPEVISISHSCIGSRWINSGNHGKKANDGTCYGCVIRKMATITTGVKDADYEKNPFLDQYANSDHLMNALAFSVEVILDYDGIDDFSKDTIEEFNKRDLFQRFALDNISALHVLLQKKKELNPAIIHHYTDVTSRLGTDILEERITLVRKGEYSPSFHREV